LNHAGGGKIKIKEMIASKERERATGSIEQSGIPESSRVPWVLKPHVIKGRTEEISEEFRNSGGFDVIFLHMAVDYRDSLAVLRQLIVKGDLSPGTIVIVRLQLNPEYSTKSAAEYARRPNTRRILKMSRSIAKSLQMEFEVTIYHMIHAKPQL